MSGKTAKSLERNPDEQRIEPNKRAREAEVKLIARLRKHLGHPQCPALGERLVQKKLRRTLLKYKLHTDQSLFDKAYR